MATADIRPSYRFGAFELQPGERRLLSAGAPVQLGRHAFDLLIVLVEHSGHLMSKDELLERVWGKVVVEENTLQANITALRKVVGRDTIATVSGQGYRFVAAVRRVDPAPAPRNHNLPHAMTTFIGRDEQIGQVQHLLGTTRLLTLTGAGGCGKTRLAVEIGARVARAYADGVWLVELAALNDAARIGETIANALDIKEQPGKALTRTLCDSLAARQLLLVLDNAEHLLDACAHIVHDLLRGCAQLSILCTSRERLGVTGELTYRVPSLAVPDAPPEPRPEQIAECESVRLFLDRARLQRPDFSLTISNAGLLALVCRRLEGIALAIELAAAQVRSMSLEELHAGLDECFSLLTQGSRTALPRHRTLRSLIDWSFDLLSEAEKTMLRRVSVFSGGWSLEAAQQVCGFDGMSPAEALSVLTSLADKSLVLVETHDAVARFGMLETLRQYGRSRLQLAGEEAEVSRRHVDHFIALAQEGREHEMAADLPVWLDRFDREHDNFRAALRASCVDPLAHGDGALRLAGLLQWFWMSRGYWSEARDWLSTALAAADRPKDAEAHARALRGLAGICQLQGDLSSAKQLYQQSLAIETSVGDPRRLCITLYNLANVTSLDGDYQQAIELYERSLAIAREIDDRPMVATCMGNLSRTLYWTGDIAAARIRADEMLAIWRSLGDWREISTLFLVATLKHVEGDLVSAAAIAEEALSTQREVGDRLSISVTLLVLAAIKIDMRDTERAVLLLREAVMLWRELGDLDGLGATLRLCAVVAFSLREPLVAARIHGNAERMTMGQRWIKFLPSAAWIERHVAVTRAALGDDAAFDAALDQGRATDVEEGVQYALAVLSSRPDRDSSPISRHR